MPDLKIGVSLLTNQYKYRNTRAFSSHSPPFYLYHYYNSSIIKQSSNVQQLIYLVISDLQCSSRAVSLLPTQLTLNSSSTILVDAHDLS